MHPRNDGESTAWNRWRNEHEHIIQDSYGNSVPNIKQFFSFSLWLSMDKYKRIDLASCELYHMCLSHFKIIIRKKEAYT